MVVGSGYIYTSADSGATWTARTAAGLRSWYSVTSSSDGTKMVAVVFGGYIYTSTNSGVNWTQRTGPGYRGWTQVVSSSDGTKLAAIGINGSDELFYTSTDSGVTWTLQTGAGIHRWGGLASSADGTKLAGSTYDSGTNYLRYIFTSDDSGVTWTEQTGSGLSGPSWRGIATSADGNKLAAVPSHYIGQYIYTGVPDVTPPTLSSFTSTTSNGTYTTGGTINVTATFNEALGASSTMTVVLDTGASVVLSNISGSTLTGTYTVASGNTSSDLTVSSITSASVNDAALNNQTSYTVPVAPNNIADTKAIVIDTTSPTLSSFTSTTSNGTYIPGQTVNITANFNETLGASSTMTVVL
ncbi:MAG: sialidase family protein, partial [Minisyncoccia bacterium]